MKWIEYSFEVWFAFWTATVCFALGAVLFAVMIVVTANVLGLW